MSRARLYMIPGTIWHLTHRCHDRSFLLRFACDRRNWQRWIYRTTIRYGLCVLNYAVTSNHVHLLVHVDTQAETVAKSVMLAASQTALAYNRRKGRTGAFWQDNYHATAVDTDSHLRACLVYIDLNMVRAGAVRHPDGWAWCGWHEIAGSRERYCLIDKPRLMEFLGMKDPEELRTRYQGWIAEAVGLRELGRQPMWTESVAVGRESFVERIRKELGLRVAYREKIEQSGTFVLREPSSAYPSFSAGKIGNKTNKKQ